MDTSIDTHVRATTGRRTFPFEPLRFLLAALEKFSRRPFGKIFATGGTGENNCTNINGPGFEVVSDFCIILVAVRKIFVFLHLYTMKT